MKAGQKIQTTEEWKQTYMLTADKGSRVPDKGFINDFEGTDAVIKFEGIGKLIEVPKGDLTVIDSNITWTKDLIVRSFDKYTRSNFIKVVKTLYDFQTKDEQASESTIAHNEVGFNGLDARFAASLIQSAQKYGSLTEKQYKAAKKMMIKYGVQLAKIANGRQTSYCL
jgi:hypothetical protein